MKEKSAPSGKRWLVYDKRAPLDVVHGTVWSTSLWFDARGAAERKFGNGSGHHFLWPVLLSDARPKLSDQELCRELGLACGLTTLSEGTEVLVVTMSYQRPAQSRRPRSRKRKKRR